MKLCTLTIIALLLIGFAGAAEPRINTAQINWTQSSHQEKASSSPAPPQVLLQESYIVTLGH